MEQAQVLSQDILLGFLSDERPCIRPLVSLASLSAEQYHCAELLTRELVEAIRHPESDTTPWLPHINFDAFLNEYGLDSEEGLSLMCLAEALLRIPDHQTAQDLIQDKLGDRDWLSHVGHSESLWINVSTWGLLLTGRFFSGQERGTPRSVMQTLTHKLGDPVAEQAIRQAMKMIGEQFVAGKTIHAGLSHGIKEKELGYCHSYDMLGEAALCQADVEHYFNAYSQAIREAAQKAPDNNRFFEIIQRDSVSIKLSALHPRYEFHHREAVFAQLLPRLKHLVQLAQSHHVPLTIDAEESTRLELSLELFLALICAPECADWPYIGLAVQAYQKRALAVIHWLHDLAQKTHKRIPVRLVKGAYWDSEIKSAQQRGLENYPVWTQKNHTDISYLACARQLFLYGDHLYPQFASHNAQTQATVLIYGMQYPLVRYEMQRLHGMGEALYTHLLHHSQRLKQDVGLRIYAPIGKQSELLAYLVRRLLENGANTSFVNAVNKIDTPLDALCQHPVLQYTCTTALDIPLPSALYRQRLNSQGINLQGQLAFEQLKQAIQRFLLTPLAHHWVAEPTCVLVVGSGLGGNASVAIKNPASHDEIVGYCRDADAVHCVAALDITSRAFVQWNASATQERARCLERMADLLEQHRVELMALLMLEAGKTYENGLSEVREAVDFCRYYAEQCRQHLSQPLRLDGPTGEENHLHWQGRGVFVCISPWNFPLAIFIGQIAAALLAGNSVIAKPASATPLIASRVIDLFHQAGVPKEVLQFLPCTSRTLSQNVLSDSRVAGVAFTGSIEVARHINRTLLDRQHAALPTLIAETGGQNAMIVDSSALPDQVVKDVLRSAFDSSGQRCSALRVLFVQEDIAERLIKLLLGAMAELCVGNPQDPANDVGPTINAQAQQSLVAHIESMRKAGRVLGQTPINPAAAAQGYYVPPTLIQLEQVSELEQEHFGPVLHVITYSIDELDAVIDRINAIGFGLTFGIHSRINSRIKKITETIRAGNIYINRDMIGAVVGCQPFGGRGLSGTGPKAGGPHYLQRFATEVTVANNSAAVGGNAALLTRAHNKAARPLSDE
jgi:RHH-type proline utilization regulon transcriptional repressor/proline dehydrogenase/delta 1-pyrroline-5-carboxylate dehydrogenase